MINVFLPVLLHERDIDRSHINKHSHNHTNQTSAVLATQEVILYGNIVRLHFELIFLTGKRYASPAESYDSWIGNKEKSKE
jgi:hypothetical protein